MPFKVPLVPFLVRGHRGNILKDHQDNPHVKTLTGQPKDSVEATYKKDDPLRPLAKPRGMLPSVSFKRVDPYTRYLDDRALAKADRKHTQELATPEEVIDAVKKHIRNKADTAAPVILIGIANADATSMIAGMAAIKAMENRGALVLVEEPKDSKDLGVGNIRFLERMIQNDPFGAGARMNTYLKDEGKKDSMQAALLGLVAAKSGAQLSGFDTKQETAKNQLERESGMKDAIEAHLANADRPLIVLTGSHHLPVLHEKIGKTVTPVTLSAIPRAQLHPASVDDRKRTSYLLASDDILKLRLDTPPGQPIAPGLAFDPIAIAHNEFNLGKPLPNRIYAD